MWLPWAVCLLLGVAAGTPGGDAAAAGPPSVAAASSEADALAALNAAEAQGQLCDAAGPAEATRFVAEGWWAAARQLVERLHKQGNASHTGLVDAAIRKQVLALKQSADGLLLALSPQEAHRIGVVRCAFQWSQNSTAIFLAVKFAHRWSSPGALKLHNESVNVSSCCFNFSASGEHSQLRKRYDLDLQFHEDVSPQAWSWQYASAGRLTVEIRKATPAVWPRLLKGRDRPNNMGVWDSMDSKWTSELREFRSQGRKKKKKEKEKPDSSDADLADAEDEALHETLRRKCKSTQSSPFFKSRDVTALCDTYWPPVLTGHLGQDSLWLVLFYSPQEMGCDNHKPDCSKVGTRWAAVGRKLPEIEEGTHVGAVDCDLYKELCKRQKVGHMPAVRRYKDGKRKTHRGDWDIDALMSFIRS